VSRAVACGGRRPSRIVAVLTLALGIGINAAVFTVTNAVLFRGFRLVDKNDRVLYIGTQKNGRGCCASYPDFLDWRAQATSFSDMGAVADLQITLSDGTESNAEHDDATQITTNGFQLLGQRPILGRTFASTDAQPGAAPVAILREAFWERRYGKDAAIIGRTIRVNGVPTTVIGVMPRDFAFPQNEDRCNCERCGEVRGKARDAPLGDRADNRSRRFVGGDARPQDPARESVAD